jgi:hypothetical protein
MAGSPTAEAQIHQSSCTKVSENPDWTPIDSETKQVWQMTQGADASGQ